MPRSRRAALAVFFVLAAAPVRALDKTPSITDYDNADRFASKVEATPDYDGYKSFFVTFPSKIRTKFAENNTVWARLMVPPGPGPFPVVLSLPILAGSNTDIESRFWKPLLDRGIAVMFIELPFQFHRRPPDTPSGIVFIGRAPETLRANFAQAVLDVRRAITLLTRRKDIDPQRIGVEGVSLGALVGAAAYAVDGRLKDAALLLGAADLRHLLEDSEMTGPELRRLNISDDRMAVLSQDIEPLLYKDRNTARPGLLVNAMWDQVIPAAYGRKLHEAFPHSSQLWVPGGHYTSVVHLVWLPWYTARYFAESFSHTDTVPTAR